MVYIVPFKRLVDKVETKSINGQSRVTMAYGEFRAIIKLLLRAVEVDEDWYRREYPDIAAAIDGKEIGSAKEHFVEDGYFEGRLPRPLELDEAWYIGNNQDVAQGLRNGSFASALRHFEEYGYHEGRLPAEY